MIRRLVVLLLAITLLPLMLPNSSFSSLAARRHGATADRPTSHGPIASLTESLVGRAAPVRLAQRDHAAVLGAVGRHPALIDTLASRRGSASSRTLHHGSALIPLRI